MTDTNGGVWVTYAWGNDGYYPLSIYATAEEATKHTHGYGSVAFWPLGVELTEAIEAWK